MESLCQVYPPHTVYEPPSLLPFSLQLGAFGVCKAPLQELNTQNMNPTIVSSAKRGPASDCQYDEHAKKSKISQANPEVDSINLSSILLLPSPGIQIGSSSPATISEDKPHAGLQAMPVLEQKALEESVLNAFEYSDNVIVLGEKIFPVPIGSEINSFLKFKRAHPNSGGRAHVLTYPQRAMPTCWNVAVQKPSDRTLLAFCTSYMTLRVEHQTKAPFEPAWYQGLRLAEKYLDKMGQKSAFLEEESRNQKIPKRIGDTLPFNFRESPPTSPQHPQPTSLHISQAVLVARGIILTQVTSKLPQPERFVPIEESHRFSWLLQASSEDVWTIHGGCGTSPKLLHIMSQINYCATRLHQDNRSIVVPLTAKKLLQLLYELKSTESAESAIDSTTKMIEQTAYAWLLTAIIYLRCRVQRYG
ncbi:hypothetical protein FOTG_15838 [Fusarium oxysporum f. sp. vasinfectum 25433]|uniref:Uncharacterized protein n=1 Tax=Fusarium oxysporum f. sp. vasinfectum 25433 TaxID=1089449 RepID=X0KQK7_FUSOX|nr:hypothetical protein FOTG_15838 [Fusarium oxysporum f. sp. vasinfectum 25433]